MVAGRGWTREEIETLRGAVGLMEWADIAATLGRSERAVQAKASRLGLLRHRGEAYTAETLAGRLGVSVGTVARWRRTGWLRGLRRRDVRAFVRAHPEVLAGKDVDMRWLVELLAG